MMQCEARETTEPVILSVNKSDQRVDLDLLVPETLSYFRGHFPRFPVLPGVVQVHWATGYGRRYFGVGQVATLQVKFRSIIAPGERIRLALAHLSERNRLDFEYSENEVVRSSGTIIFEPR